MTPPACPSCGGGADGARARDRDFTIWRCGACGLFYCDPLPDRGRLEAAYTDAYAGATTGYFSKVDRKLARSRGRMADLLREAPQGAPTRFLDVGCNGGFMVAAALEAGIEGHGLDPDPVSIAYARTHYPDGRFTHAFLEDYAPPDGDGAPLAFEAVYCSEVIEHAPDPNRFVAALRALMVTGGALYLTTPDAGHWRVPRDFTRFEAYCPPDHCLYFTRRSLGALLERHGFTVTRWRWAFKPGIKVIARAV